MLSGVGFENGKLVRVTLEAQLGERSEVNTFHYDLDDASIIGTGANDPQTLADTFRDDVRPHWAAMYKDRWTILPVVVVQEKDPQNPTAERAEWSSGASTVGTFDGGGDLLGSGLTVVASLRTAHIGRRFSGRLFLGGDRVSGQMVDNNWVSGLFSGIMQPLLDAVPREPDIASGISAATAKWCVYSRTQRAANLDPYASAITTATLRTPVHWRRKRANIG